MATGTLGSSARDYHTRQMGYLCSGTLTAGTGGNWLAAATTKIGTIPAGSSIRDYTQCTSVVGNAGTNNQVSFGNAASGAQLLATANLGMAALGSTTAAQALAAGILLAADTDVWVTNQMTGTTATTGTFEFFVNFYFKATATNLG